MKFKFFFAALAVVVVAGHSYGQSRDKYEFVDVKTSPVSEVKNQASSGTCWCFATVAVLESDILKNAKGEVDLSEMWVVRNTYLEKAKNYVRMHGKMNLGEGGAGSDAPIILKKYGMVPEEAYPGLDYGTQTHQHAEMSAAVVAYLDAIVKNPNRKLSTAWEDGLNGILDAYLGEAPEKFTYKGKEYTPMSFAAAMGLDGDDYTMITSFTHHPFGQKFVMEVPDNWSFESAYNVPLEELETIIDNAIAKGYTVSWAADVSEKGFNFNKGFAVVPATKIEDISKSDMSRWTGVADKPAESDLRKLLAQTEGPGPEMKITQDVRQKAFDNYETTDDHSMQIVGVGKDQNGTKYYKVKNSWGKGGVCEGFFYVSIPYVNYKTLSLVLHKDGVPADISARLNIR